MLPAGRVPVCLVQVLAGCRGVFTARTFATFVLLVTGALGGSGARTVTGMWSAAGMSTVRHWSSAHRFFSHARWDTDALGLALARIVVAAFVAQDAAVTVAVDDTLFHRYGRKVFGVFWQHDGSAKGRDGIGRGNCFVIAGLVTGVPFTDRKVFLPLLFRLHQPKTSQSKPEQARQLVDLLAATLVGRRVHVVADNAYKGSAWRALPRTVTFTTRLASNAVLYAPAPPRTGRRGRPALKGARLGTPTDLAATATWDQLTVTRYGHTDTVHVAVIGCLWWGSLHRTQVNVILLRDPASTKAYDIALVTTDITAPAEQIIARYADRWSIEQAIKDNDIVLVDFWAEWCGPCKRFGPIFEASSEANPEVLHAKVDTEAEQGLAGDLGITSIPTLMAFREKVLVFSQPGALNAQQLEQVVDAVKALDMEEVHAHVARSQAEAAAASGKQDGSQIPEA